MVEELARDYSQYLRKTDVAKEIKPLCSSVEEMMARLEEFESLLVTVKIDSNATIQQNIPQILAHRPAFDMLCERIDSLDRFVAMVHENLNSLEQTIEIAEEELNVTDYSLKGLLKPLFNKTKSSGKVRSNLENGEFKTPIIFKPSEYFPTEPEPSGHQGGC